MLCLFLVFHRMKELLCVSELSRFENEHQNTSDFLADAYGSAI